MGKKDRLFLKRREHRGVRKRTIQTGGIRRFSDEPRPRGSIRCEYFVVTCIIIVVVVVVVAVCLLVCFVLFSFFLL